MYKGLDVVFVPFTGYLYIKFCYLNLSSFLEICSQVIYSTLIGFRLNRCSDIDLLLLGVDLTLFAYIEFIEGSRGIQIDVLVNVTFYPRWLIRSRKFLSKLSVIRLNI